MVSLFILTRVLLLFPCRQCPDGFSLYSRLDHTATAEKDEDTKLTLIGDNSNDFLTIYGKPVYVINEMSGQPISLLRLGYPEIDTGLFTDDDFMLYNNVTTEFQEFIEGPYSVVLKYTGLRWLGESKLLALVVPRNYRFI